MTSAELKALAELETPCLSDAMDRLAVLAQCLGTMPARGGLTLREAHPQASYHQLQTRAG